MKDEFLFVYGTLRREAGGAARHILARYSTFVGEATYQGRLYKVSWYPGAVPSDDPADLVRGEVYRLRQPDLVLSRLDRHEEYGPGFADPSEYVRLSQEVRLRTGQILSAWIYVYNRPVDGFDRVPDGDFLGTGGGSG